MHGTALAESCGVVGGPQVRNVATIGGNVAHALPAADGAIGLLALGAEAQICTLAEDRVRCEWRPLLSLFAGPGQNTLMRNQMVGAFRFPVIAPGQASAFDRIMRPQGVALPILGVAVKLTLDETGRRVQKAAIAIGPAGPIPFPRHGGRGGAGGNERVRRRRGGSGGVRGAGAGQSAHKQVSRVGGIPARDGGGASAAACCAAWERASAS